MLQVVAARGHDPELPLGVGGDALFRNRNRQLAGQVLAGDRLGSGHQVGRQSLGDDPAAVHAGAGTEIDDVVGLADGILVVLDDDHGVAQVAQAHQRVEQALVVALVQADRRFVQDVHDADEARADLAGQADSLRFAARQGLGAAIQRQVVEPDVVQEAQPVADLLDDLGRDLAAPARQRQRREERRRLAHG